MNLLVKEIIAITVECAANLSCDGKGLDRLAGVFPALLGELGSGKGGVELVHLVKWVVLVTCSFFSLIDCFINQSCFYSTILSLESDMTRIEFVPLSDQINLICR